MKMLLVLLITSTLHAQTTRPIQIGDFFRMKRIASPALSPDGRRVVFAVTTPDLAGNTSATDLWLSTVDGKSIRQLTTHSAADRNPVWSPDGRWIAFESTRSGENQIWLLSTSGGEPRQFTTLSTRRISGGLVTGRQTARVCLGSVPRVFRAPFCGK